jgi:hypothetical protein
LDEQAGFFFGSGDSGFALGLQRPKLGHVLFDRAEDALLVGREELQIACLSRPGSALGEGGVDFGVGASGSECSWWPE